MTGTGELLAHGVGSREDLPIPFSYAVTGAAVALIVSFLALGLLWREPRLHPGRPVARCRSACSGCWTAGPCAVPYSCSVCW